MTSRVLIIGGYGVFGGKLATAISQNSQIEVIVAGRNLKKATDFCEGTKCGEPYTVKSGSAGLVQASFDLT